MGTQSREISQLSWFAGTKVQNLTPAACPPGTKSREICPSTLLPGPTWRYQVLSLLFFALLVKIVQILTPLLV